MAISKENLLKLSTVKSEEVELETLKELGEKDCKVKIRQLTIEESSKFRDIIRDKEPDSQKRAIKYACQCAMVKPSFFTDEELEQLNDVANVIMMEVHSLIPLIGKTKKEKEQYYKKLEEEINKVVEKEEESEEEVEKK